MASRNNNDHSEEGSGGGGRSYGADHGGGERGEVVMEEVVAPFDATTLQASRDVELDLFRQQWQEELNQQRRQRGPARQPTREGKGKEDDNQEAARPAQQDLQQDQQNKAQGHAESKGDASQGRAGLDDVSTDEDDDDEDDAVYVVDEQPTTRHDAHQDQSAEEKEALSLYFKGAELEEGGCQTEALYFYRRAAKLVPDIEFRAHRVLTRERERRLEAAKAMTEDAREGAQSETRPDINSIDDLCEALQGEALQLTPAVERPNEVHFGELPAEIVHAIALHLLRPSFNLAPILRLASTCRFLFVTLRDDVFWKHVAQHLWSPPPVTRGPWPSWREHAIRRPRPLFHGVYVSRVVYLRRGEQGLDELYKPWHTVQYFRYLRLLPSGHATTALSCNVPAKVVQHLRQSTPARRDLQQLHGTWTLEDGAHSADGAEAGDPATVVVRLERMADNNAQQQESRRRGRRGRGDGVMHESPLLTTFTLRLRIHDRHGKPSSRLSWERYSIAQLYARGTETASDLDLNNEQFKPFRFIPLNMFDQDVS